MCLKVFHTIENITTDILLFENELFKKKYCTQDNLLYEITPNLEHYFAF